MRIEIIVEHDNIRLTEELKLHLSKKMYKHIKGFDAKIYLNGELTKTFVFVNKGDKIEIDYDHINDINWNLYESKLDIYYEDDNYLVVYKKSNLLTIPTKSNPKSLYQEILYYLKNKNEELRVSILNRLDKNTEGLVLVAKNPIAASLQTPVHEKIKRKYLALCHGIFDKKEDRIILNIKRSEDSNKRIVDPAGQIAITNYKVIKEYDGKSLVEFVLETGRTHQIRLTSAYLSHPIVGDEIYGIEDNSDLHLLSYYISFYNPYTNKNVEIELDYPNWD